MALRAKYEADFSEFYSATAQAVTSLDSWENKGQAVEKQMDQVAHSMTGAPVVSDIKGMSTSMDEFGVQTVRTSATVNTEASGLSASFQSIGTSIAAAFTVQQISAFVVGVMDAASKVGDLSVKMGISTDAVQRFKFAAEQSGTTIDSVGRSIQTMNNKLSEGGKGTIAALDELGLKLSSLRDAGPEQAFIAIADAIAGIDDPMERTRLAMEIFGKSGVENMQMFQEGVRKVGEQTAVMSEETIRRLKAAQDSWSAFSNSVTVYSGEALGAISKFFSAWQKASEGITAVMHPIDSFKKSVADLGLTADGAAQNASDLGMQIAQVEKPAFAVGEALKPVALNAEQVDAAIGYLNVTLVKAKDNLTLVEPKLGSLSEATRNMARGTDSLDAVMKAAAQSTEVWNSGLRFTSEVVGELPDKVNAATDAIQQLTTAQAQATAGPQMGTSSPGGTVNTAGITVGGPGLSMESVFDQYTKRFGGNSSLGMIGGGPPPDFLSWALSMGLASRNAPTIPAGGNVGAPMNQTINMNGLLGTNDPATRELIKTMVGDAFAESMRGQRLLSSA